MAAQASVGPISVTAAGRPLRTGFCLALAAVALAAIAPAGTAVAARGKAHSKIFMKVPYGPGAEEVANIYPGNSPQSRTVVLVHGGGWRKGSAGEIGKLAKELQEHGSAVINMNYPLDSPTEVAFPKQVDAVQRAVEFMAANSVQYAADPAEVVMIGGSAGGQLVARGAEQLNAQKAGWVDGVVTLSAPTDFLALLNEMSETGLDTYEEPHFIRSTGQALGCQPATNVPACSLPFAQAWSPRHNIGSSCSRWLLFSAEADKVPLSQAQSMRSALQSAGCSSELVIAAPTGHGFGYWDTVKAKIFTFVAGS